MLKRRGIILVILLLFIQMANAAASGEFRPLFEDTEIGELVEEHIYQYEVQYYKQPLKLPIVDKKDYKFNTPEDALIANISAAYRGDIFDLSSWDTESRMGILKSLEKDEVADRAKKERDKVFKGADFYLLRRVDGQNMVVLDYKAEKSGKQTFRFTLNFRQEYDQWKATNKYSSDYVSFYLDLNKKVITGNVDW